MERGGSPKFKGGLPSAAVHNALVDAINVLGNARGVGGAEVGSSPGGGILRLGGPDGILARITGGSNPYSWEHVDAPTGVAWQSISPGGSTTSGQAYEINGYASVPAGKVVELYPGYKGDWRFQYARRGYPPQCQVPCPACSNGKMPVQLALFEEPTAYLSDRSYVYLSYRGGRWISPPGIYLMSPAVASHDAASANPSDGGCSGSSPGAITYEYEVACGSDATGPYVQVTRRWYLAWAYETVGGTVSVSHGSSAVVGSGTSFTTDVIVGDLYTFGTDPTSYKVISVADDANLTLATNYAGPAASGVAMYWYDPLSLHACDGTHGTLAYRSIDSPAPPGATGPAYVRTSSVKIRSLTCTAVPDQYGTPPSYWEGNLAPDSSTPDPNPVRVGIGAWSLGNPIIKAPACVPVCMPCFSKVLPATFLITDENGTWPVSWRGPSGNAQRWIGMAAAVRSDVLLQTTVGCTPDTCPPGTVWMQYYYQIDCSYDYSGRLTLTRRWAVETTSGALYSGTPCVSPMRYAQYLNGILDSSSADLAGQDLEDIDWTVTLSGSKYADPISATVQITSMGLAKWPPTCLAVRGATAFGAPSTGPYLVGAPVGYDGTPSQRARAYDAPGGTLLQDVPLDAGFNGEFSIDGSRPTLYVEMDPPNSRWLPYSGVLTTGIGTLNVPSNVVFQPAPGYVITPGVIWKRTLTASNPAPNHWSILKNTLHLTTPGGDVTLAFNPSFTTGSGVPTFGAWWGSLSVPDDYMISIVEVYYSPPIIVDGVVVAPAIIDCCKAKISGTLNVVYCYTPGSMRLYVAGAPATRDCDPPFPSVSTPKGKWISVSLITRPDGSMGVDVVPPPAGGHCADPIYCCAWAIQSPSIGPVCSQEILYPWAGGADVPCDPCLTTTFPPSFSEHFTSFSGGGDPTVFPAALIGLHTVTE